MSVYKNTYKPSARQFTYKPSAGQHDKNTYRPSAGQARQARQIYITTR